MNFGLVVEGTSDAAAYPELIRLIRPDIEVQQIRPCFGKSRLKGSFNRFLREFHKNPAWRIEAAFVIEDSDCQPSQKIENRLKVIFQTSRLRPRFPVKFFAPKCDLETWLVADENALSRVSQQKGKNMRVTAATMQFEIEKAKPTFFEQLSKAGLDPVPSVYAGIARFMDIERVAALCPSFRRFIETVRAC